MMQFSGKSVYKGIVLGPISVLGNEGGPVRRSRIEDTQAEIERVNAEYAVAVTGDNFSEMFAAMDNDYMKARAADVKDISNRLIRVLEGRGETSLSAVEPAIIVADDLSPSETVQMDKEKILAFVTVHGSTNSHTAILARMMNIPALIGVSLDLDEIHTGMMAVVDGFEGTVTFEPDEELCKLARQKMEEEQEKLRLLDDLKGKENVTLDGRKINLYANIHQAFSFFRYFRKQKVCHFLRFSSIPNCHLEPKSIIIH